MQPIIGIVPRTMMSGSNYKTQVNFNYLEPFIERGISTIILPLEDANLENVLNLCDGFVVIGGGDIDPKYYNEENDGLSTDIDARVDYIDKKVIMHAVKYKKPMLGICRGIQVINVFFGGTLYQDIDQAQLKHDVNENSHLVNTVGDDDFSKKFQSCFVINSYHHQALKDVPSDFSVIFKHNEIIEGIIHKSLPILAVQWHPERLATKESKLIFDWLKDEAIKYHNNK